MMTAPAGGVTVFWRPGCLFCAALWLGLRASQTSAHWINIWEDRQAAEQLRGITGGPETVPTVLIRDHAMINPTARQVAAAVRAASPSRAEDAGSLAQRARLARWRRPRWH
ncbi:MAG TPA: glutaredoxin domain-containing protein [Streptosporangiaceae bacterium]